MRLSVLPLLLAATLLTPFSAYAQIETVGMRIDSKAEDLVLEDERGPAELKGTVQSRPISLLFTSMDSNRDRLVSRAEVQSHLPAEWKTLKPSFTNKVSALKITAWAEATLGSADALPSRLSFDRNLDNQVSETEFSDRILSDFDRMDEDEDGQLSRSELVFVAAPRIIREEKRRPERQRPDIGQQRRR